MCVRCAGFSPSIRRLTLIKDLFKTVMLTDLYLSAFMLAYEFIYLWLVRHFDDFDSLEISMFILFTTSKIVLNLTASYSYATRIGWQFTTKVAKNTKIFRLVHL